MILKGTIMDIYDRKLLEDKLRIYEDEMQEIEKSLADIIFIIESQNHLSPPINTENFNRNDTQIPENSNQLSLGENRKLLLNKIRSFLLVKQPTIPGDYSCLENLQLLVIGINSQEQIEYVNAFVVELTEYTKAEIIGKNWLETFGRSPEKKPIQPENIITPEKSTKTQVYKYQNSIFTKSGAEKIITWHNTLLHNTKGEVIATLCIGEDITKRDIIEKRKDEFLAMVSHELRTPLTSIHGALNLIATGLIDVNSERGKRVIDIAAESADRLVRLVNDILELERLESGKISLIKQVCNAGELIIKARDAMQVMANRNGVNLAILPQNITIFADSDRLIQILTNLIGNAIKFSRSNSTIFLTVEMPNNPQIDQKKPSQNSQHIIFKVQDQGRGIPNDKLESIFERFNQVDAADSRKKGGTGLGLAICRSIVKQHGGEIWVESILGEGSSFYFTIPLAID